MFRVEQSPHCAGFFASGEIDVPSNKVDACLNLFNSEQVHAWIIGTVVLTAAISCRQQKTHRVATVGFLISKSQTVL